MKKFTFTHFLVIVLVLCLIVAGVFLYQSIQHLSLPQAKQHHLELRINTDCIGWSSRIVHGSGDTYEGDNIETDGLSFSWVPEQNGKWQQNPDVKYLSVTITFPDKSTLLVTNNLRKPVACS